MAEKISSVKFKNSDLPKSGVDLFGLEDLFARDIEDHNPCKLHQVNFFIILFITEGLGSHTIDFVDYDYAAGSILTVRKDQIHKFSKSSAKGFLLLFTDQFIVSYLEHLQGLKTLQLFNELLGSPHLSLDPSERASTFSLIQEISNEYFQKRDDYSLEIIRGLLQVLIMKLYRLKAQQQPHLREKKYLAEFLNFQKLVESNCFETKRVVDYAGKMNCSSKTLNKIVRTIVNKTAKQFIDDVLVKQVKRILINSSSTINEIAYQTGFSEPSNFYKYFKKYTGISPETFRKNIK